MFFGFPRMLGVMINVCKLKGFEPFMEEQV